MQYHDDHISMVNLLSGCEIKVLSPQPSSGSLEKDVNAVFDLMYQGWQYQKSGEKQYDLAKGYLPKGLEYYMKEATMTGYSADGRYNLQEGTAMVVKTGSQVIIIATRHNSSSIGHDECYRNYNTWKKFPLAANT